VDAVCEVPQGAHPGSCLGFYDYDPWFLKELVHATREGEKRPERFRSRLRNGSSALGAMRDTLRSSASGGF